LRCTTRPTGRSTSRAGASIERDLDPALGLRAFVGHCGRANRIHAGLEREEARPRPVRGEPERQRLLARLLLLERHLVDVGEAHLLDDVDEVAGLAHGREVAARAARELDRGDRSLERLGADRERVDLHVGALRARRGAQHGAHVVGLAVGREGQRRLTVGEEEHHLLGVRVGLRVGTAVPHQLGDGLVDPCGHVRVAGGPGREQLVEAALDLRVVARESRSP
jgi:hypothetical protein